MTIYEDQGYVEVSYNASKNYVLFNWTNASISFESIKKAHLKAMEVEKSKGVSTLIADCSNMKYSFSSEITDWFSGDMMPKLAKEANIKRIVTVLNGTAMAKLNASSWQRANNIELPNVGSMTEAEDLVL